MTFIEKMFSKIGVNIHDRLDLASLMLKIAGVLCVCLQLLVLYALWHYRY